MKNKHPHAAVVLVLGLAMAGLHLADLLTGIGIGLFGLCGLVCAWEACGKETE